MYYAMLLTGHQPVVRTGRWLAALGTLVAGRYSRRPVSHA